jgi:L-lactate dehydrogenase complex protein LldG
MTDMDQTRFMGNIKKALNRTGTASPHFKDYVQTSPDADDFTLMETIQSRNREMRLTLLDKLTDVAKTIHTRVVALETEAQIAAAIVQIAADSNAEWGNEKSIVAWDHPLVKRLDLPIAMQSLGIPVYFPEDDSSPAGAETFRRQAETALIGVTSADFGLAETATLSMKTRTIHSYRRDPYRADPLQPQGALYPAKMGPQTAG